MRRILFTVAPVVFYDDGTYTDVALDTMSNRDLNWHVQGGEVMYYSYPWCQYLPAHPSIQAAYANYIAKLVLEEL